VAGNKNLNAAAKAKNDEFYTQYDDIQRELNCYYLYDKNFLRGKTVLLPCDDPHWSNFTKFFAANFELYGLKKLISTGYAEDCKKFIFKPKFSPQIVLNFDEPAPTARGKIFTLDETNRHENKNLYITDIRGDLLEGDGDFRSDEVKKLRDEADVIITNPPFSLFREFLAWILAADKKFLIIGNINCITYKEVFPLIKENKIWLGNGMGRWISGFLVPDDYELYGTEARLSKEGRIVATNQCLWLTNLEHGRRHQPLRLMTYEENLQFNKKIRGVGYQKYDNYDAIEVPSVSAIPSDYEGVMGVPITFLDKYCPEQFQIVGATESEGFGFSNGLWHDDSKFRQAMIDGKKIFKRLFIRHKR